MTWTLTKPVDVRNAWLLWAALTLAIVIHGLATDHRRTVTPNYVGAAVAWYDGADLYTHSQTGTGFIYLPPFAVMYGPIAHLPFPISEAVWRVLSLGVLALGVRQIAKLGSTTELFPLMTLMVIPCALAGARNGQLNLALVGILMFATAALAHQRWTLCAACLALAVALKPQSLALALLMIVLHPRLIWRFGVGLMLIFALPLLTAKPGYVIEQYRQAIDVMVIAAGPSRADLWDKFADVFGALRAWEVEISRPVQTGVRALAAAATLGLVVWGRPGFISAKRQALFVFAAAMTYLVLFNPRTENNSYILLAPAVAYYAAGAWLIDKRWLTAMGLTAVIVAMAGSFEIGKLIHMPAIWLAPLGAAGFAGFLIIRAIISRESAQQSAL